MRVIAFVALSLLALTACKPENPSSPTPAPQASATSAAADAPPAPAQAATPSSRNTADPSPRMGERFVFQGEDAQVFPGLKALTSDDVGVTLYYDPALTEVINQPFGDESVEFQQHMLRTRLTGDSTWYAVDCASGPSADPGCTLYKETANGKIEIGAIGGERHFLPGNGAIYSNGRSNRFFPTRMKSVVRGDALVAVAQPYQYVGLRSITTRPISLSSDRGKGEVVAQLPAGTTLEVLLADDMDSGDDRRRFYLIRTDFGLLGWIEPDPAGGGTDTGIAGLRFYGD